jgi:hypothetical protein
MCVGFMQERGRCGDAQRGNTFPHGKKKERMQGRKDKSCAPTPDFIYFSRFFFCLGVVFSTVGGWIDG